MSGLSVPRRTRAACAEEVPETGECVLLDRERGTMIALNPTGAAVWELIDGRRSVDELAAVLGAAAGLDAQQALRDVEALLAQLDEAGFLV